MLDITANPGFVSLGNDEFVTGINDGSIIAGVNGPWNSDNARSAWGDNYAAAKLPTFTLAGRQVQMGGVVGHKLMGVNAFSEYVGWAMLLAEFLTNYDNQVTRFEVRGQGPSNIQAAASPAVQAEPALAALAAQAQFSAFFAPGGDYWGPMSTLGEIIVQGNPDGVALQTLLDNTVAGITS
jgi:arabinogalactan oligomer/maltooligosaccharide transport system substrate-binding protein